MAHIYNEESGCSERMFNGLLSILDLTRLMAKECDLDNLFAVIIKASITVLSAERASLFILDKQTDELWSRVAEGEEEEIRFPVGSGISGTVIKTRKLLNTPDAYNDPRFNQAVDKETGFITRNMLTAPLVDNNDEVVGVLQVLNKNGKEPFGLEDEALITALAVQAGSSLNTALLLKAAKERDHLRHELGLARKIQRMLLPEEPADVHGLDVAGWSEACDETGGDYYDYFRLAEDRWSVAVGDVSGHGIAAALIMSEARALLLAFLGMPYDLSEIMNYLNVILEIDLDDRHFMTMAVCAFEANKKSFSYCSAGHEPLIHIRGKDNSVTNLNSTGTLLGAFEDVEFTQEDNIAFESGDYLVMFTDGMTDAVDEKDEAFGRERLTQEVIKHKNSSAKDIVSHLVHAVREHINGGQVLDDWTLVVIKAP